MINIYAYTCLLSALSVVEMKPLYVSGRVGESVTFKCSGWNVWTDVTENVKYLCVSPCSEDHHILIKAAYGKTTYNNRLKLYNEGKSLFVTFKNLQKSDSKTYLCGVERFGSDSFIEVILNVIDAHSPVPPKKTPTTVMVGSTPSVPSSSTVSSNLSHIMTETSPSSTTLNTTTAAASATQGSDGSVPYLVIGVIAIITILLVLLKLMSKMMKQQLKVVPSAATRHEDTREDAAYDEIRPEDQPDSDVLYANYSHHQVTELAAERGNSGGACPESRVTDDSLYSVAQLPRGEFEPTGQCEPTQPESNNEDSLYSLAQLPRAT